ncbi:MAG: acetylornithine deacetylase [Granulosicoccaceae bacterium]
MNETVNRAIEILEKLVSFDSISGKPTHNIISYVQSYLSDHGIHSTLSYDDDGERANIFATIGPRIDGGIVLNGHTDVVPVVGQNWSTDPFVLTRKGDRLHGRGSVDMKGFLACVLASVPLFESTKLTKPIHIAFTYDEEIGGLGMPVLLKSLSTESFRPDICIVGEPTEMKLITGHKGGYEMLTKISGFEVHSSNPAIGVNAISAAVKIIAKIEAVADRLAAKPYPGSPFEPPYCTINVGTIEGGTASNATAGWCNFKWEFRPMPGEDGAKLINEIERYALNEILPPMKAVNAEADIKIITEAPVPPLDDSNAALATTFVSQITGLNSRNVVSFGTDAGYFSDDGISTVVFGPGSISRAHQPNEYIEVNEIAEGLAFLEKVAQKLTQ